MMQIAIIGSGAMGSLYGGQLAENGHNVTLVDVWEEHVQAINENGLTITTPDGDKRSIAVSAVTDAAEAKEVDLVIIFVKSVHTEQAIIDAASLLSENVDVLTLQNGLGNPEKIAEYVPKENVIAGVSAHGSTLDAPGRIIHAGEGTTTIGRYFTQNDSMINRIAEAFSEAGFQTEISNEIRDAIWEKVLVNIGINAPTALTRVENGYLVDTDPGKRVLEAAVMEAAEVARNEGSVVREDIVDYVRQVAEATGENRSSMRQDIEAGRQTEIETLNGEVVRRADEYGINVPINRMLSDLVRLNERGTESR